MGMAARFAKWVERGHLRHQLWWAMLVEQPFLLFLVFFLESYIPLAIIDSSFKKISPSSWLAVFLPLFLIAWLQFNEGWSTRTHPRHIANMAAKAGKKVSDPPEDFSYNIYWIRHCLAGMARLGRYRSGGHFEDLLLMRLSSVSETSSETEPNKMTKLLTMRKMLLGIEMQMARELASPQGGQQIPSSIKFCNEVALFNESDGPTVGEVADLIADKYLSLAPEVKTRLESMEERTSLDRIHTRALKWQIAVAILTVVSGILGIFVKLIPG